MPRLFARFLVVFLGLLVFVFSGYASERLSLAGNWKFTLTGPAPTFPQGALPEIDWTDHITLPGTTETRGKGPENPARETGMLTRVRKFDGAAWYQTEIDIPANWAGQQIELLLERTKYTQLWCDGKPVGEQGLYTVAQRYDLTRIAQPGRHTLTLLVDNRPERRPVQGEAHQFSDNTQTNWNGVIGRIELLARPALWLDAVRVDSQLAQSSFRLQVTLGRTYSAALKGNIRIEAESFNHEGPAHRVVVPATPIQGAGSDNTLSIDIPLGPAARRWDEFSPALYRIAVTLESPSGNDECLIETGLREFKPIGTHFAINGRVTFLRGKHDACVFPETGHPPMDVEGWLTYLRICRDYGINHIRCHTWTPPAAAFTAADRLGIYLQPELPFWGTFDEKVRDFLMPEARALLREYGNHPSFVMLTLGNELGGDRALMNAMVAELRSLDSRHLYADGSNNVLWDPRYQPSNDFWPSARTKTSASGDRSLPARGSYFFMDGFDGPVQWGPAETRHDLRAAIEGIPAPFVGHEIAQYTVYPDFQEIARYTGVTRALNFDHFRAKLARRGLLDQAPDFMRASGKLAASLYSEEIELALRTPGYGGFQLLDLQDFPGQGTALVGVLNAFMESKGLITAEEWRRFCSPIVPLARFDRYTWTAGETFTAEVELAHFGAQDLTDATIAWQILDSSGNRLAHATLAVDRISQGGLRPLTHITTPLIGISDATRAELVVTVSDATHIATNRWPLWIYAPSPAPTIPETVALVRSYDAATKALLAAGRRVILMPDQAGWGDTLRGGYATDFWCWPMFYSAPGTMGLLIDHQNPALVGFPTTFHSERQWSRIAHAATPVILTDAPAGFRPIVQVIDNLDRNERLGLIFESKVGPGSLLVIACDLSAAPLRDAPEARQLLTSLYAYAASPSFAPATSLPLAVLETALRPSLAIGRSATASSSFTPPWGFVPTPAAAIDTDTSSRWQAADADQHPSITIDLGRPCTIDTIELLWEHDEPGYRYQVEGSGDGQTWTTLSDQRENSAQEARHLLSVQGHHIRHLRVLIDAWPANRKAALRDLRALGHDAP